MSNEFSGLTLNEVLGKAVASDNAGRRRIETKNNRACNDLVLEISSLQREIGRLSDDAGDLERDADGLRRSAAVRGGLGALAALGGLANAMRGVSVAARIIRNRSVKNLSRSDIDNLLAAAGTAGAAGLALLAVLDIIEAQKMADEANEIESRAAAMGNDLLSAINAYDDRGCGRTGPSV